MIFTFCHLGSHIICFDYYTPVKARQSPFHRNILGFYKKYIKENLSLLTGLSIIGSIFFVFVWFLSKANLLYTYKRYYPKYISKVITICTNIQILCSLRIWHYIDIFIVIISFLAIIFIL